MVLPDQRKWIENFLNISLIMLRTRPNRLPDRQHRGHEAITGVFPIEQPIGIAFKIRIDQCST